MALSEDKLGAVKKFMKVDDDEDDDIIVPIYAAANLYLKRGVTVETEDNRDLYNLAAWNITLHWYDHRDEVGNDGGFGKGLRDLINHLKFTTKSASPI